MNDKMTFRQRLVDALAMLLVAGLSLLLLIYIGYGEAQRTFQSFHVEKLAAQGRLVQNAMEGYLRSGLPLKQFAGFATITRPLVDGDDAITSMTAFDQAGAPVFSALTAGMGDVPLLPATAAATEIGDGQFELREDNRYFQVVLPLRSRYETVGSLAINMPRAVVTERLDQSFRQPLLLAGVLAVGFAGFVALVGPALRNRRVPWLQVAFAVTFLAMAAVVVAALIQLYAEGAQAKSKALADSLSQRLRDLVEYNLNVNEVDGLDKLFADYRRLNPDISAAGLMVDGKVTAHTDPEAVGRPWAGTWRTYEYTVQITPPNSARQWRVAVALPEEIVYRQVFRSVKNFAALFVASAFLAGLFLQLAGSLQQAKAGRETTDEALARIGNEAALNLVKPVFFVAVFLEHLTYSFLPQFVQQVTASSGLSSGLASAPFMVYYVCFALTLIPAGHVSQQFGPRALMYGGLMLAAAGLVTLALPLDFYFVTLARALSGIGQGMLFIGVQSYILAVASPAKRTQGAAIIVFGFQGGMISGTAIGSLLVVYMGPDGVFTLAAVIAIAMALYTMLLVPMAARRVGVERGFSTALRQLVRDIGEVGRSLDFLKTMVLIGIPAKAVLTGIVVFALPLLLAQKNYAQEDIGQVIMLYAAGVLLASSYASRLVDRAGRTEPVLFWGSAVSGIGLLLIGLVDWEPISGVALDTEVLIAGVIVVGIAHGFINAPVVTHVADLELAARIGVNSVTATYRFLERIGHAAGPIIVGQLFFFGGQNAMVLAWMGAVILLFGFLFLLRAAPTPPGAGETGTVGKEMAT